MVTSSELNEGDTRAKNKARRQNIGWVALSERNSIVVGSLNMTKQHRRNLDDTQAESDPWLVTH